MLQLLLAGGVMALSGVSGATVAQLLPLLLLLWFWRGTRGTAVVLLLPGEIRLGGVAATDGVNMGVV